jgi:hypothetical protein
MSSPKLYFLQPGLACRLENLSLHARNSLSSVRWPYYSHEEVDSAESHALRLGVDDILNGVVQMEWRGHDKFTIDGC